METIAFLREQLGQTRSFLDGTIVDVSEETAHASAPGRCNSIAATYAHLVCGEDSFVNGLLRGEAPLLAGDWGARTGISEMPPQDADWHAWGERVRVDMPAARMYAAAVGEQTDAWLASLTSHDLRREIDFSAAGFGNVTLAWVLGSGVLGHITSHWGEICALKGLQGGKGFPV